jgi:hemerythrin
VRVQWEPRHGVGNASLDDQHRNLLARCDALADCLDAAGPEGDRKFDEIFEELMALAREHFAAEEALLTRCGYPELEDYQSEREEFDYLSAEIITTGNFDRHELQNFLALWWTGHIRGAAQKHRAFLERQPAS